MNLRKRVVVALGVGLASLVLTAPNAMAYDAAWTTTTNDLESNDLTVYWCGAKGSGIINHYTTTTRDVCSFVMREKSFVSISDENNSGIFYERINCGPAQIVSVGNTIRTSQPVSVGYIEKGNRIWEYQGYYDKMCADQGF